MNPGIVEEAGQTARSLVSGLVSTPALLSLVVFNLGILATLVFYVHERNVREVKTLEMFMSMCKETK